MGDSCIVVTGIAPYVCGGGSFPNLNVKLLRGCPDRCSSLFSHVLMTTQQKLALQKQEELYLLSEACRCDTSRQPPSWFWILLVWDWRLHNEIFSSLAVQEVSCWRERLENRPWEMFWSSPRFILCLWWKWLFCRHNFLPCLLERRWHNARCLWRRTLCTPGLE